MSNVKTKSDFARWVDNFLRRHSIDQERVFQTELDDGTKHTMKLATLVDGFKESEAWVQETFRKQLTDMATYNTPLIPFLRHLARQTHKYRHELKEEE